MKLGEKAIIKVEVTPVDDKGHYQVTVTKDNKHFLEVSYCENLSVQESAILRAVRAALASLYPSDHVF